MPGFKLTYPSLSESSQDFNPASNVSTIYKAIGMPLNARQYPSSEHPRWEGDGVDSVLNSENLTS